MSKFKWMLLALFTLTAVPSCFFDLDDNPGIFGCLDGEGPLIMEQLDLSYFSGIDLKVPATVFITQGPELVVTVEGKPNIIDELERDIHNDIWEIETHDCVRDIGNMKFFITMPDITSLKISSSGDIIGENVFQTGDVELGVFGSGDIDIAIEAEDIYADILGSGNMFLEGSCDELFFELLGSGDLRGFNLEAREAYIEIVGSGNAHVFVNEELDVKISGSGNVFYKGNPTLSINISGSGAVIDAN